MPQILKTTPATISGYLVSGLKSQITTLRNQILTKRRVQASDFQAIVGFYNTYRLHSHAYYDLRGIDTFGNLPVYGGGTYAAPAPKLTGPAGTGTPQAPTYVQFPTVVDSNAAAPAIPGVPDAPTSFSIIAVSTGLNGTWTVSGNHIVYLSGSVGRVFKVTGNSGTGNGTYYVNTVVLVGPNTQIGVLNTIPVGATATGNVVFENNQINHLDFNYLNTSINGLRTHLHQIDDIPS